MSQVELDPKRWMALALVGAAFFMTVLDVSIVNVALPTIQTKLHFSDTNLQWVITAYAITYGGLLLLGGRAADLIGRRKVFMGGLALFTVASLLAGLAQDDVMLIIVRGVQGVGAAIVAPAALSIVGVTFQEGAERNKALGIYGALAGSGAAIGVLLGGVLTT
jgi:MFS family permease